MIKPVLTFLADMGLVAVLLVIMSAGLMGARLPYRQPAINSGSYQLEAFPTGLALYQYGRVSPFYSLSPLNDYVMTSGSGRTTLVSKITFDQNRFVSSMNKAKPYQIGETIQAYLGDINPSFLISTEEMTAAYTSEINPAGIMTITRSIHVKTPRWIDAQAMTLSYNASDEVLLTDGVVMIANPSVAGSLVLTASLNQTIAVDKKAQLIEVMSPVNQMTDKLVFSIKIKGMTKGEQ